MNTFSRVGLTLVTGASMALVAAPAYAHPDSDHHDPVVEVGEWTATPPEFYEPITFQACGSTISMEGGDVRRAEERVSVLESGATLIEGRGQVTVDLTRESDGAMIDELDISGPVFTTISADGTKVTDTLFGASIMFPFAEAERPAFLEAFGTDLAYFSDPAESVTFKLLVDPETGEVQRLRSIEVDAHIVDLCQEFDGHGDEHHDHYYDHHHDHGHHYDHGH
jgi:hypothetical protein